MALIGAAATIVAAVVGAGAVIVRQILALRRDLVQVVDRDRCDERHREVDREIRDIQVALARRR